MNVALSGRQTAQPLSMFWPVSARSQCWCMLDSGWLLRASKLWRQHRCLLHFVIYRLSGFGHCRQARVCDVARAMLTVLQRMHALGVIHRDVKLENIFIGALASHSAASVLHSHFVVDASFVQTS